MDGVCLLKGLEYPGDRGGQHIYNYNRVRFFLTLIFVAFFISEEIVVLVWIVSGILLAVVSGCSRYNLCLGIGS